MLNMVALIGRLTADPELRHTPNGVPVTTFTVAVNRAYVKQGAERNTDFIDIVAWRNTAEFASKYFRKGQLMAINGSIQTRSYEDKETGKPRKAFEILANNVFFCEGRKTADAPTPAPEQPSFNEEGFEPIESDEDLPF